MFPATTGEVHSLKGRCVGPGQLTEAEVSTSENQFLESIRYELVNPAIRPHYKSTPAARVAFITKVNVFSYAAILF